MSTRRRFPFGDQPAPLSTAARPAVPAVQTEPLDDFIPPERVLPFRMEARTTRLPAPPLPAPPVPERRRDRQPGWLVAGALLVVLDALALYVLLGRP